MASGPFYDVPKFIFVCFRGSILQPNHALRVIQLFHGNTGEDQPPIRSLDDAVTSFAHILPQLEVQRQGPTPMEKLQCNITSPLHPDTLKCRNFSDTISRFFRCPFVYPLDESVILSVFRVTFRTSILFLVSKSIERAIFSF